MKLQKRRASTPFSRTSNGGGNSCDVKKLFGVNVSGTRNEAMQPMLTYADWFTKAAARSLPRDACHVRGQA